ncbi:MAG: hypothetical protein QXW38_08470 [Candidatus Nitrosotenuis sp.]
MGLDTAVGKAIKVLFWVAISGAIAALLQFFTDNPNFFTPPVVGIINVGLVALKNFVDPRVKNI